MMRARVGHRGRSFVLAAPLALVRALGPALALLLLQSVPVHAFWFAPIVQSEVPDARAVGMGGAFTAVADGASGVWWNPGSLGLLRGYWALPFSRMDLYGGDADQKNEFHAYGISGHTPIGGIAVHLNRMTFNPYEGPTSNESSFSLGYGRDLVEAITKRPDPRFAVGFGGSLKRNAMHSPDVIDPAWQNLDAWDIDLGLLGRFEKTLDGLPALSIAQDGSAAAMTSGSEQRTGGEERSRSDRPAARSYAAARVGFVARNALDRRFGPDRSHMGRTVRAGAALEAALVPVSPLGHVLTALVAVDQERVLQGDDDPELHYGVEGTLLGILSCRYGETRYKVRTMSEHGGVFTEHRFRYTIPARGLGLRFGGEALSLHFDYSKEILKLYSLSVHWTP